MYTIILFVLISVLGYFAVKAARHGKLNINEIPVFAILSMGLAGYAIFLIVRVF
jgi:hypothetical protein